MILIDAIFIHNGGGKVLLDYLVEKLELLNFEIYYLFDERLIGSPYLIKKTNKSIYLSASLIKRNEFYKEKGGLFSKIFILGNIPPIKKINAKTITYFHNLIYLSVPKEFGLIDQIKYKLKIAVIRLTKKNTDSWIVQSDAVKTKFIEKFGEEKKIEVIRFFPELFADKQYERERGTMLYVSNGQANKNHKRLIEAFCMAYDKTKKGKLVLTVDESFSEISDIIKIAKDKDYPVVNLGFINRSYLAKEYLKSEYVIYPSLSESFGLGIIEGVSLGCKIIGADLPYTYAVCSPSLTFNPQITSDIKASIITALEENLPVSKLKVHNEIEALLKLLIE